MKLDDVCHCQSYELPVSGGIPNMQTQRHRSWFKQGLASLLPTLVLILMPKCPVCVAVWVTFFTGVGLSLTFAAWLRLLLIVASCVVLTLFVFLRLKHLISAQPLTGRAKFPVPKTFLTEEYYNEYRKRDRPSRDSD